LWSERASDGICLEMVALDGRAISTSYLIRRRVLVGQGLLTTIQYTSELLSLPRKRRQITAKQPRRSKPLSGHTMTRYSGAFHSLSDGSMETKAPGRNYMTRYKLSSSGPDSMTTACDAYAALLASACSFDGRVSFSCLATKTHTLREIAEIVEIDECTCFGWRSLEVPALLEFGSSVQSLKLQCLHSDLVALQDDQPPLVDWDESPPQWMFVSLVEKGGGVEPRAMLDRRASLVHEMASRAAPSSAPSRTSRSISEESVRNIFSVRVKIAEAAQVIREFAREALDSPMDATVALKTAVVDLEAAHGRYGLSTSAAPESLGSLEPLGATCAISPRTWRCPVPNCSVANAIRGARFAWTEMTEMPRVWIRRAFLRWDETAIIRPINNACDLILEHGKAHVFASQEAVDGDRSGRSKFMSHLRAAADKHHLQLTRTG
jgi:hypothetical protein